jgi:hypothetical protein
MLFEPLCPPGRVFVVERALQRTQEAPACQGNSASPSPGEDFAHGGDFVAPKGRILARHSHARLTTAAHARCVLAKSG